MLHFDPAITANDQSRLRKINVTYNGLASRVCTLRTYCESSTIVQPVAKSHNLILANAHTAREFAKKIVDNSGARCRSRIPRQILTWACFSDICIGDDKIIDREIISVAFISACPDRTLLT